MKFTNYFHCAFRLLAWELDQMQVGDRAQPQECLVKNNAFKQLAVALLEAQQYHRQEVPNLVWTKL